LVSNGSGFLFDFFHFSFPPFPLKIPDTSPSRFFFESKQWWLELEIFSNSLPFNFFFSTFPSFEPPEPWALRLTTFTRLDFPDPPPPLMPSVSEKPLLLQPPRGKFLPRVVPPEYTIEGSFALPAQEPSSALLTLVPVTSEMVNERLEPFTGKTKRPPPRRTMIIVPPSRHSPRALSLSLTQDANSRSRDIALLLPFRSFQDLSFFFLHLFLFEVAFSPSSSDPWSQLP